MLITKPFSYLWNKWRRIRFKHLHPNLSYDYSNLFTNTVLDHGSDNKILVGNNSSISDSTIKFFGSGHTLRIGDNVHLHNISFRFEDNGGLIEIGDHTSMEHDCHLSSLEGANIIIGNDCMLSTDVDIRTSDSHSIISDKGERINPAGDVVVGNHVWIGVRSTILKGSKIADNCVIAANSTVSSKSENISGTIIAGAPAKVVKENINWDRKRI